MSNKKPQAWPGENQLKREMHRAKVATGKPLGQCYEDYAKELGFNTYAAYRAAKKEIWGIPS